MSTTPLTFLERKWQSGASRSNTLFDASTQNSDRQQVTPNDRDIHRNITNIGRRNLATLGNHVYSNSPIIRGVIEEIATLATSSYIPQYYGRNKKWWRQAEEWIYEHDKICDYAGWPYNMATYRRSLVISNYTEGELNTAYVRGESGYPFLQTIPAHRVGSRNSETQVIGGAYDGLKIIDGVIINDFGRAVARRVYTEDGSGYRDISARDLSPSFLPGWLGQIRGLSILGMISFDQMDVKEWRRLRKMAQKTAASRAFEIHNESGEADTPNTILNTPPTAPSATTGLATSVHTELVDGVTTHYFKANKGCKINNIENNNPSANEQAFEDLINRDDFFALGWSKDFSITSGSVGGASMRVVVEKINSTIGKLETHIIAPAINRFNQWRIAVAIELGILPPDEDWYKVDFQGPARVTADKKYDSDVDIKEIAAGISSRQRAIGKRGGYWEECQDEDIEYEKRLQVRCAEEGVDPNRVILLTPNGNPPTEEVDGNRPVKKKTGNKSGSGVDRDGDGETGE